MDCRRTEPADSDLVEALRFVIGRTIAEIKADIAAADERMQTKIHRRQLGLTTTGDSTCGIESY